MEKSTHHTDPAAREGYVFRMIPVLLLLRCSEQYPSVKLSDSAAGALSQGDHSIWYMYSTHLERDRAKGKPEGHTIHPLGKNSLMQIPPVFVSLMSKRESAWLNNSLRASLYMYVNPMSAGSLVYT